MSVFVFNFQYNKRYVIILRLPDHASPTITEVADDSLNRCHLLYQQVVALLVRYQAFLEQAQAAVVISFGERISY